MKKDHIQSPIRRENSHIIHHLQPFGNIVLPLLSVLLTEVSQVNKYQLACL